MIDFHEFDGPCDRCDATAWEFVGEFVPHRGPRQDVIACAYCGLRLRVPAATFQPASSEPQFREGRHAGKTVAEVAAMDGGVAYLGWYAENGKSPFMRQQVAAQLATLSANS